MKSHMKCLLPTFSSTLFWDLTLIVILNGRVSLLDSSFHVPMGSDSQMWVIYIYNCIYQILPFYLVFQVLQSFEGGPEVFLRQIATSYISGLGSIQDHLLFYDRPAHSHILYQICDATQLPDFTFKSMWLDFLNGTGIPCPQRFREIQETFSNVIDLTDLAVMDTPAFHSRMFVWAATGSPLLQGGSVAGDPIGVSISYFPSDQYPFLTLLSDYCRWRSWFSSRRW